MSIKKLLVIIPDDVNVLLAKGEYPERYYNPGNLFDEVHILITNAVVPDADKLQFTVGSAKLHVHNLPVPHIPRPFGRISLIPHIGFQRVFARWRLRGWVEQGLNLAEQIQPQLIRCHGSYANTYLGRKIKQKFDIPYLVSLHINPDEDKRARYTWHKHFFQRMLVELSLVFEREALQNADKVLPVYQPILDYLKRLEVERVQVCYNMLNIEHLIQKTDYTLHSPPRIISVGRQFAEKNPDNLIRAVAKLDAELTMVGDGEYHQHLKDVAKECGIADRVHFLKAISNDELCAMLPTFDIFATHSEYWEISKSILEPLITGLPIIFNQRLGKPVPELQGDWIHLVENTVDGYYNALQTLLTDDAKREALGRRAYNHAQNRYAPPVTEAVFVDIYRDFVPALQETT